MMEVPLVKAQREEAKTKCHPSKPGLLLQECETVLLPDKAADSDEAPFY